jgi:hypothetical protein
MIDSAGLPLAVGHADVVADMPFHSSMRYFQSGDLTKARGQYVQILNRITQPLTFAPKECVVAKGDILADVTIPEDGTLIVYGDVEAHIRSAGHCEIVVAGSVRPGAVINSADFLSFFAGGDVAGSVGCTGSCKAWIEGSLRGELLTGTPSTRCYVRGDFMGQVRPIDEAPLLYVVVEGFMPMGALEAVAAFGYTVFNASVGRSDRPAGLYPDPIEAAKQHKCRKYNRWAIRAQER